MTLERCMDLDAEMETRRNHLADLQRERNDRLYDYLRKRAVDISKDTVLNIWARVAYLPTEEAVSKFDILLAKETKS